MDAGARSVFFSFSSKDRKVAQTIATALEARGFSCWLATRDVKPGENYQVAIVQAINKAKVLLLVFSSNTGESDEIKKELSLASRKRLAVLPVRVEDVMPDEGMAYELATRQWIDLFADWEQAMGQLGDQIATIVPPAPKPAADAAARIATAPPTQPEATAQATQPEAAAQAVLEIKPWYLGAAAAVLVAAGLGYYVLGGSQATRPAQPPVVTGPEQPSPETPPAAPLPHSTQMLLKCMQADADLAIKGCTEALADAAATGATRGGYLKFRGSAYTRKFEYDAALADFTAALALTPKDGQLYLLRASIKRMKGDNAGADADAAQAKALGFGKAK